MKITLKPLLLVLFFIPMLFSQVYMAPDGNDANNGSITAPLKTLGKAVSLVTAGGTIYVRGGTYACSATVKIAKSGTATSYYKILAYQSEKPVLDFSTVGSGNRGIELRCDYWYLKGIQIKNAGDNGMIITGGYNIIEMCELDHNGDSGLQISQGGHHTKVINCDSHDNHDAGASGGNADGFSPKLDVGDMNEFHGCRSWHNSDDGWDLYGNKYNTSMDSCWTWGNGWDEGNGNGFKTGGSKTVSNVKLTNCVSFNNSAKGFDQNHNMGSVTIYNCTSYRNGSGNYYFYEKPTGGTNTFKNNISYKTIWRNDSLAATVVQADNSWLLKGSPVSDGDFENLDSTQALLPRKADGSLPDITFLHLKNSSKMIDAGVNVGLGFTGSAPDLGAFEWKQVTEIENNVITRPGSIVLHQNYPNPFNPATTISYQLTEPGMVRVAITNMLGEQLTELVNENQVSGYHSVSFNAANFASGIYLYSIKTNQGIIVKKMSLLK